MAFSEPIDNELCFKCKGRGLCNKKCFIYEKIQKFLPKSKTHFSGSSPPEIFVGRENYPQVNTGIIAPQESGNTEDMSLPELWHEKNLSIQEILDMRGKLIYSRFKSKIKGGNSRFLSVMQEVSLASKSVSAEIFFLEKPIKNNFNIDKHVPVLGNPAPLKNIRLEENPFIEKKVDYIVSDTDNKAVNSINELYKSRTLTSNIIKILSAGMLGLKRNRKLVPTRWAITAVDDTLSKLLLKKIRYYPEINEILIFHGYYVGNHYEFLLLPDKFSFEVIEAYFSGSSWNKFSSQVKLSKDYEFFNGRKTYAQEVTGAYYTAKLALCEYLEKIKRQAYCIVFREERPEYNAPLGVGILRQIGREAFSKEPDKCESLKEALEKIQSRIKLPIDVFTSNSTLLQEYKKQTRLDNWI